VALANTLADSAMKDGVEAMKAASLDMINPVVQKVGEKIELGTVEMVEGATIGAYVHGGKSAVVVTLSAGTPELAKDVAMHIAAMKPAYMTRDEISEDIQAKVKEMFMKDVAESDKPEEIKAKMLEGKIGTYFKEQTLVDQPFIKNPDMTVGTLLANNKATLVHCIRESIG
jgi:elongation factor Ts